MISAHFCTYLHLCNPLTTLSGFPFSYSNSDYWNTFIHYFHIHYLYISKIPWRSNCCLSTIPTVVIYVLSYSPLPILNPLEKVMIFYHALLHVTLTTANISKVFIPPSLRLRHSPPSLSLRNSVSAIHQVYLSLVSKVVFIPSAWSATKIPSWGFGSTKVFDA